MRLHMQLHLSLEPRGVKRENEINWKSPLRHSGSTCGEARPVYSTGSRTKCLSGQCRSDSQLETPRCLFPDFQKWSQTSTYIKL